MRAAARQTHLCVCKLAGRSPSVWHVHQGDAGAEAVASRGCSFSSCTSRCTSRSGLHAHANFSAARSSCAQERNYIARKEAERKRRELFDDALSQFKKGKIEEVGAAAAAAAAGSSILEPHACAAAGLLLSCFVPDPRICR